MSSEGCCGATSWARRAAGPLDTGVLSSVAPAAFEKSWRKGQIPYFEAVPCLVAQAGAVGGHLAAG